MMETTASRLSTAIALLTWTLLWAGIDAYAVAAADRADVSQSKHTGRVVGTVWLGGTYEKPARLKVFKNRQFCGSSVPNETFLVNSDGGIQNVAIILQPLHQPIHAKPASIALDNRSCAFAPHVQIVPVGSQLLLKNSDPILHTVHARLGQETLFNVGLPRWRQVTQWLTRSGIIRIDCDVLHTWMSAAIVVTSSPFFAISDPQGRFDIGEVPAGEYEMTSWHEKLGTRSRRLVVTSGAQARIDIIYGPNQSLR
jgi:hypothetical protein